MTDIVNADGTNAVWRAGQCRAHSDSNNDRGLIERIQKFTARQKDQCMGM